MDNDLKPRANGSLESGGIRSSIGNRGKPPTSSIRITLVDGDQSVYLSIQQAISAEASAYELSWYSNPCEALRGVASARPDLILIDTCVVGVSGIECVRRFKALLPEVSVVMFGMRTDMEAILFSLLAGASGYLVKPLSAEKFTSLVTAVARRLPVLCSEAEKVLVECLNDIGRSMVPIESLSLRERQIMTCLFKNLTDKEIADAFGVSAGTIHAHLVRLYKKLGAHSRAEAIQSFLNIRNANVIINDRNDGSPIFI